MTRKLLLASCAPAGPAVILGASLFLAFVSLASGCRPAGPRGGGEESTLTLLLSRGSDWAVTPLSNVPAMHLLNRPLFVTDTLGEIQGELVRSWESRDDGRTWTYRLRPGVRWHDGVPFTAHDIKFTFDLFSHPAVLRRAPGVRTVTVLDDSTFTIAYSRPMDPFDAWNVFLPRHLLRDRDPERLNEWEFWQHPIGNGPYRWVRSEPETLIELEANPDYFKGKPRIERVILKLGGDDRLELLSENVDATGWPPVESNVLRALESDSRFRIYCGLGDGWSVTYMDHRDPTLSDPRVRRALRRAIDREELVAALGARGPASGGSVRSSIVLDVPVSPNQIRRGEIPEPIPYDPKGARQLLEEAGWRDADGDGLRERNGQPLRLRVSYSGDERLFVIAQAQLRRVGIGLDMMPMIESVGRERLAAGDVELFDVEGAGEGGLGLLQQLLVSSADEGPRSPGVTSMTTGYQNPDLARLVRKLEQTWDPDERDAIYRQMWPIFMEDAPVLFWPGFGSRCEIAHRRVRGLSSPHRSNPELWMDELWIEDTP